MISDDARRSGSPLRTMVLLALFVVGATPGSAQTITGVVREASTGRPVVGALVRLLDTMGAPRGTAFLTASDGRYGLRADAPGQYYLTVERIGYATARLGPVEVGDEGSVVRDLTLLERALELEGLTVEAEERDCDLSDGDGSVVQATWSQVQTALAAATWTKRQGLLDFRLRSWERRRKPGGLAVLDEVPRTSRSAAGNSVRSLPAEELAAGGYVRAAADGTIEYYAPDAEAILSDSFLARHCFTLRKDAASGELVGLAFEPLPDQDTTDISGVIWVHQGSSRLDRVEFRYTGLKLDVGTEYAGGVVRYVELQDGRWIVSDWHIRAPIVGVLRSSTAFGTRSRQVVESVYETGAEVLSVRGANFEWVPGRESAVLRGIVYDSTTSAPLSGAVVRVAGRAWRTRADAAGQFELAALPVGLYRVVFEHPRLDSLGLAGRGADIQLRPGNTNDVVLSIPSMATLLAETCPPGLGGVLVGWVTAGDGATPVAGATVRVRGPDGVALGSVVSGRDGAYRVCGLPEDTDVTVVPAVGGLTSGEVGARTVSGGYGRADVQVSWTAASAARSTGGLEVLGTVVDAATRRPLPAATVVVVDTADAELATTITDQNGAFSIRVTSDVPTRVEIRSLGYTTARSAVLPRARSRHRLEVELASEAVEISGVVVSVEGRTMALARQGFYDRSASMAGVFIERAELSASATQRASDALLRVAGVQPFSSQSHNTTKRRIQFRGAIRASGQSGCMPAIYIDGRLARWGEVLKDAGADYPTLDDLVGVHDIEGIELYDTPSTIPPQFMGPGTLCGAIVIWTR